jgi:thioredoxin-related protein
MKRLFFAIPLLLITISLSAQVDTTPPFKRFPTVPPFRLLQVDSVSILTRDKLKKNKPVLLMLFNPECDHCKQETEAIIRHIDDLKNVQIIMATMARHKQMKEFYLTYKLDAFKNIIVGQDFQNMLPSFYKVNSLPYLAMYDKKGNLLTSFEGSMKIEDLINVFSK